MEQALIERKEIFVLPAPEDIRGQIQSINQFQKVVRSCLVQDLDYGVIPGTDRPTLLKPGAEKITKLLGLSDTYEIVDRQEDWGKPFFRYLIRCTLKTIRDSVVISEGMGECNSYESKYRYRDAKRKCPSCGAEAIIKGKQEYGGGWLCFKKQGGCGAKFADGDTAIEGQSVGKVENEDIYSLVNTILKMAEKRALVDAALHAGRLSDVFTQDVEDLKGLIDVTPHSTKDEPLPFESTQRKAEPKLKRDPNTVKTITQLMVLCKNEFGMEEKAVLSELNVESRDQITDSPAKCYEKIQAVRIS